MCTIRRTIKIFPRESVTPVPTPPGRLQFLELDRWLFSIYCMDRLNYMTICNQNLSASAIITAKAVFYWYSSRRTDKGRRVIRRKYKTNVIWANDLPRNGLTDKEWMCARMHSLSLNLMLQYFYEFEILRVLIATSDPLYQCKLNREDPRYLKNHTNQGHAIRQYFKYHVCSKELKKMNRKNK